MGLHDKAKELLSRRRLRWLISWAVMLFASSTIGHSAEGKLQTPLALNSTQPLKVGSNFDLFEDSTSKLTLEDILRPEIQSKFWQATPADFNEKFTKSHYWVRFTVRNRTDIDDWYIAAQQPLMTIVAQQPLMTIVAYRLIGEQKAIEEKSLERRLPVSKVVVAPDGDTTFLLRVHSSHVISLQFDLMTEELLVRKNQKELILISLVAGCFLAMFFYNFFLYISLWDKNYLYYLFFVLVNSHLGFLAVNFPIGIASWWGLDWCSFSILYRPLGPLAAFLFSQSFLQIEKNNPRLNKVFTTYMIGLLLLMVISFIFKEETLASICDLYFLVGIFILIYAGIYKLNKGFGSAQYYLLALGSFLIGVFVYLASLENILPMNTLTSNAHLAGQAIEMLLMSLALAAKIKLLQEEKTRAELVIQIKSRLLKVIAHDIANPLAVIKFVADILRRKELQTLYMDKILRSVEIIQEIMSFVLKSEMIGEDQKLSLKPVSIKEVFDQLSFVFQSKAEEKGLLLKFDQDDPAMEVMAEKTSLTNEVLGNLLSNAIKFSLPGGEIRLHASEKNQNIIIMVKDRGIGMSVELVQKLFSQSKVDSRRGTQDEAGTGYGLFLAKSFVTAFGGHIQVKSRTIDEHAEQCGSTFRITLPKAPSPGGNVQKARRPLAHSTVEA